MLVKTLFVHIYCETYFIDYILVKKIAFRLISCSDFLFVDVKTKNLCSCLCWKPHNPVSRQQLSRCFCSTDAEDSAAVKDLVASALYRHASQWHMPTRCLVLDCKYCTNKVGLLLLSPAAAVVCVPCWRTSRALVSELAVISKLHAASVIGIPSNSVAVNKLNAWGTMQGESWTPWTAEVPEDELQSFLHLQGNEGPQTKRLSSRGILGNPPLFLWGGSYNHLCRLPLSSSYNINGRGVCVAGRGVRLRCPAGTPPLICSVCFGL